MCFVSSLGKLQNIVESSRTYTLRVNKEKFTDICKTYIHRNHKCNVLIESSS